ncbi:MAG: phosphodiester glycosidase family protein, partial [Vulcanimicrobiaceae bacterium]
EETFNATIAIGPTTYPLSSFNLYPVNDLGILTPAFGPVPPNPDVTIIPLTGGNNGGFGHFLAGEPADNTTTLPAGTYLVVGPSAYSAATIPPLGAPVEISGDLAPIALSHIRSAIGGGPLLLRAGQPVFDPDGPNFSGPIPASAVGINADGDLLLLEVDGRQASRSVGLTRPQLAALFLAFGASEAMALDGGGSSTLVATIPGIGTPTVRNSPSDGIERPVGDALIVTSTAPIGQPAQISVRPSSVRAVPGASVPLHIALLDANFHTLSLTRITSVRVSPATLGSIAHGAFIASSAGQGELVISSGGLRTRVPIEVAATPTRLLLLPMLANLDANARITFRARAFDAHGYPLALPSALPWTASHGQISEDGSYLAGKSNAQVKLRIGALAELAHVLVGRHSIDLKLPQPTFQTYPRGGDGSVTVSNLGFMLDAVFVSTENAAYAVVNAPLPESATSVRLLVDGDGCGAVLRIAVKDSNGTSYASGKTPITWAGRREVAFALPKRPALTLQTIYLVRRFGTIAISGSCHVGIARVMVDVAGTGPGAPQRQ